MGELTIEWGGLHNNALAAENPLETELTPSSTWLTAYTPATGWGVTTGADNVAAYATVTWQPRRGTTPLPFRAGDLAVAPGVNDPDPEPEDPGTTTPTDTTPVETTPTDTTPVETTPTATTPAATTPATTTPVTPPHTPSQVKPKAAPTVKVAGSVARRTFTAKGLTVTVGLPEGARVHAVLVRTEKRRGKPVTTKLTWSSSQRLAKGTNRVRLAPSAAGQRALHARTKALKATLVVTVTYADASSRTVRRTVLLTPPKQKGSA
jgi:hypothetical protein